MKSSQPEYEERVLSAIRAGNDTIDKIMLTDSTLHKSNVRKAIVRLRDKNKVHISHWTQRSGAPTAHLAISVGRCVDAEKPPSAQMLRDEREARKPREPVTWNHFASLPKPRIGIWGL